MQKINLESYKEKIKELYCNEKISLVKIAKEIGVSAGTLRKNMILWGIDRRSTTKRELNKPNKEELERLYLDKEQDINKVVKKLDVDPTTLFRWLKEYKITPARRWKHDKANFSGNGGEKAYIWGLVAGDIHARRHNRQVLAELTTTHPAMIDLFFSVFGKYGTPKKYLKHNKITGRNEWKEYVLLDNSFNFVLLDDYELDDENFYHFLAGFFDCEGCFYAYHNSGKVRLSWLLYNSDKELLERIKKRLEKDGFHPKLNKYFKKGEKTTQNYFRGVDLWALCLYSKEEAIQLMGKIPIKHREKIEKFEIIKSASDDKWITVSERLADFKNKLKLEVKEFIKPQNERSTILPQVKE